MLRPATILITAACLILSGCIHDECKVERDCGAGQYCFLGSCLQKEAEGSSAGGAGGQGGVEGEGGAGGEPGPGDGGTGGTPEPPIPREKASSITLEILADPALSLYLRAHEREVLLLIVRAISRGSPAKSELEREGPYGWSALDAPHHETLRLELEPLELAFDEAVYVDDPIEFTVEAMAAPLAGGAVRLARARLFGTVEAAPIAIPLSLDPAYDHDGDGLPELDDCDPDDPRLPGQTSPCDGVPSSCHPGICHVDHASSGQIYDIQCDGAQCYVSSDGIDESVLVYDTTSSETLQQPTVIASEMLPVELAIARGADFDLALTHFGDLAQIAYRDLSPSSDGGWRFIDANGALRSNFVRHEEFLYVGGGNQSLFALDLTKLERLGAGCVFDPDGLCHRESLAGLSSGDVPLAAGSEARRLTLRPISSFQADVYASFDRDPRIGLLPFDGVELVTSLMTLLEVLDAAHPRDLHYSPSHHQLFVVGGATPDEAEGAVLPLVGPVLPIELPPGACPSVVQVLEEQLLLADDCQGMLWVLPLGAFGLPELDGRVGVELPGCKRPSIVATQGSANAPILVGCADQPGRVFVVGRD